MPAPIDLRKEFNMLMDGDARVNGGTPLGYYVLYQRGSRKVRCSCWDPRNQEPDAHCATCTGIGWIYAFERHKIMGTPASQVTAYPHLKRASDPATFDGAAAKFFMRHNAMPQMGDRILRVGWQGNVPVNLIDVHEINHVEPVRGDNGRIEYFWAASRVVVADFPFQSFVLRSMEGQVLYVPRFSRRGEGL